MEMVLTSVLLCFDRNKKEPHKSNMLYICIFVILTLSSSREFSMGLNDAVMYPKLPFDLAAGDTMPSTYGNLLIYVLYRAIRVGPRILAPLYKSMVSIIANISPYLKNLTKDSSEAILKLA